MEMKRSNAGRLCMIGYDPRERMLRVEFDDGSAIDYGRKSGVGCRPQVLRGAITATILKKNFPVVAAELLRHQSMDLICLTISSKQLVMTRKADGASDKEEKYGKIEMPGWS
ncbi:MAG: hypothetical protein ACXWJE_05710 [Burkholderiaceae bacterium]